jgi:hypothetical protein
VDTDFVICKVDELIGIASSGPTALSVTPTLPSHVPRYALAEFAGAVGPCRRRMTSASGWKKPGTARG